MLGSPRSAPLHVLFSLPRTFLLPFPYLLNFEILTLVCKDPVCSPFIIISYVRDTLGSGLSLCFQACPTPGPWNLLLPQTGLLSSSLFTGLTLVSAFFPRKSSPLRRPSLCKRVCAHSCTHHLALPLPLGSVFMAHIKI